MLFKRDLLLDELVDVRVVLLVKDVLKCHNFLLVDEHDIFYNLLRKWLYKFCFLLVFLHHVFEVNSFLSVFIF